MEALLEEVRIGWVLRLDRSFSVATRGRPLVSWAADEVSSISEEADNDAGTCFRPQNRLVWLVIWKGVPNR
jgi:hypothetical protein